LRVVSVTIDYAERGENGPNLGSDCHSVPLDDADGDFFNTLAGYLYPGA
jgi:hypothetical protein